MRVSLLSAVLGCAAVLSGCSKPAALKKGAEAVESPASLASATPISTLPALPADAATTEVEDAADNSSPTGDIEPFVDIFEAPKGPAPAVVAEPEPEIVEMKPGIPAPPRLRLIGFVKGEQSKALVTIAGDLQLVKVGDKVHDLEFTSIAAPAITMKYYDEEITMNLFDQRWEHAASEPGGNLPSDSQSPGPNGPPPGSRGFTNGSPPVPPSLKLPPGLRTIPSFPTADQPGFPGPKNPAHGPGGPALPGLPTLPSLPGLPATP